MMIEEIGVVKSVEGVLAKVDVPKKSACEGCTAGTCKPDEQCMEIEALNRAGAKVGQRVKITVKSITYMKGTMLVYGLPAIFLVLGAVVGKELVSKFVPGVDPDILSALFGFGACAISFVIVKILSDVAGKNIESKPVIEKILDQ